MEDELPTSIQMGLVRITLYVMVSKFQWKPFWLATQRDPQNDWTATPNRVNYDVFAQAPLIADWSAILKMADWPMIPLYAAPPPPPLIRAGSSAIYEIVYGQYLFIISAFS